MARRVRTAVCLFAPFTAIAASLLAQQKAGVPDPRAYGIEHVTIDRIGAPEFKPVNSRTDYDSSGSLLYSSGGAGTFHASAHIPKGALLTFFDLDYCDGVTGSTVEAWLYTASHTNGGGSNLSHLISTTQVTCTSVYEDLTPQNITFNANTDDLFVDVETHGGDISSSFSGVSIFYQLQVSPAPATATFADVPTNHPYFKFIEALASSGITKGCGSSPLIFCPNQTITRQEVATWMAKALGLDWP
jgi:hypothetical protein